MAVEEQKIVGYLPNDTPPWGAMLSLAFQQVLTMFPATVLVAILTKFDVGVTLLASGFRNNRCVARFRSPYPDVLRFELQLHHCNRHRDEPVRQVIASLTRPHSTVLKACASCRSVSLAQPLSRSWSAC